MRVLGRYHVYLKSATVLEAMARVDSVVFDKTGTLTAAGAGSISFQGTQLNPDEERWLYSMTRHSTHPYAVRIGAQIAGEHFPDTVRSFLETPGCGMEGSVAGHEIWMGSAAWLGTRNVRVQLPEGFEGSTVHVAIDGKFRGCFLLSSALRADAAEAVASLTGDCRLALLSGDNEKERSRFEELFGDRATLRFNQSPLDKLDFVREQRELGGTVMMVGDGLNDSGALRQSDVGVAVVEDVGAFSPASDVILRADMVSRIHEVRQFSRKAVRVVRLSFLVSSLYNIVGIAIAARGMLSPVVCAVLMPLSSITVVAFSCGLVNWLGSRSGLDPLQTNKNP